MNLPSGFSGTGVSAGLKSNDTKDLTVIVNEGPQYFGTAVFTTNKIVAAPVTWSMEVVKDNEVKAVILNSGGANACTGPDGFVDTHKTAEHVAELLSISASDVVVCSTGLIGVRLLMDKLLNGASAAIANLSNASLIDCATGIMTTDSKPKISTSEISGSTFTGIAKGAGMLAPSLATMLSVIMTDAIVDEYSAKLIFEKIVDRTFNRIDSDGCTSTNDTVLFLASGASGVSLPDAQLEFALQKICSELSFQLIADAEGHSKIVSITTINALSESDAVAVGRACARNNLLKCALHGEDPNWGRILAAIGTTSATFDPYRIDVNLNGVQVCTDSSPGADRDLVDMSGEIIEIVIDLNMGSEIATIMTNDLSAMYVHENSAYAT